MNIDGVVVFEFTQVLLRVLEGQLEAIGVGPGEVSCVCLRIKVVEGVRELDLEVAFVIPGEGTLAALPLHRVGADSVDRPQSHLVEFALRRHTFNIECQSLTTLDSLDIKVEPGVVVALVSVRQGIA